MGIKAHLAATTIAFGLCIMTWGIALWLTGARVDYRSDPDSSLVALYLTPKTGVSIQWWSEQGQSVWFWTPESNVRVWPGE